MKSTERDIRAFCVGFYRNSKHALHVLDSLGWCDTFYCEQKAGDTGGMFGPVENLRKLDIDYKAYNVCLTFNDSTFEALVELERKCMHNNITIIGNQHGYDKSVIFIKDYTPNPYVKYWNAMGQYWLDRYKICLGKNPISNRWVSIGSLKADYLYKYYQWDKDSTNNKVLLLHEPDTDLAEKDPNPLKPTNQTKQVVKILKELNIDFDFKLHPSWPDFIANKDFIEMWKPEGCDYVNIDLHEMRKYNLVIGCYSTTLLEAAAMGIPVINIEFEYPKRLGSHWGPGEMKLFPRYAVNELKDVIFKHIEKPVKYNQEKLKYFLGPLGQVSENYHEFLAKDLDYPKAVLRQYYSEWKYKRIIAYIAYVVETKILKILIHKILRPTLKRLIMRLLPGIPGEHLLDEVGNLIKMRKRDLQNSIFKKLLAQND